MAIFNYFDYLNIDKSIDGKNFLNVFAGTPATTKLLSMFLLTTAPAPR